MVAIKNVLFFAISATAAILPARDITAVQNSLNTVNSDVQSLTKALNSYNGGFSAAIPVQQAADKLNNDLKSATTTANNNAAASETEAQTIINYINNTLEPNVKSSINAAIAKKDQFTTDGLKPTVKNTLTTIQTNTNDLSNALIAKSPSSKKSAAQAAASKINSDIQAGVTAFS